MGGLLGGAKGMLSPSQTIGGACPPPPTPPFFLRLWMVPPVMQDSMNLSSNIITEQRFSDSNCGHGGSKLNRE